MRRFERDVFPTIGSKPIAEIKPVELLAVLVKIEARGVAETAHRARGDSSQVFRYAIATGRAEHDIAADLVGALAPKKVEHFASVTEPAKVGESAPGAERLPRDRSSSRAMRLAPLVFVRPGELRHARWGRHPLGRSRVALHRNQDQNGAHRRFPPKQWRSCANYTR